MLLAVEDIPLSHPVPLPHVKPDRILVVDDDLVCARLMAVTLELAGYCVDWTTDPVIALGRVSRGGYRLLISDVNMPGMTGTELAAAVKRIQPGISMLLVTAFVDPSTYGAAVALGAAVARKPLRAQALLALASEALGDC